MFDFPQPGEIYRSAGFPDVAVIGIDNTLYGKICTPQLTSLDNKLVEVSRNACRLLLNAMEKREISHKMLLNTEIIIREST